MPKQAPPNTAPSGTKPNQMPAGTGSAGETNQKYEPMDAKSVVNQPSAPSVGPEIAGGVSDNVESHEIRDGVTEVHSDIDPNVPAAPAPTPALGIDPAHVSLDVYPSEASASLAPGVHVDMTNVVKPVGVFTPAPPPFHKVDGSDPSQQTVTDATKTAAKSEDK